MILYVTPTLWSFWEGVVVDALDRVALVVGMPCDDDVLGSSDATRLFLDGVEVEVEVDGSTLGLLGGFGRARFPEAIANVSCSLHS